jgi:hypothetical protein
VKPFVPAFLVDALVSADLGNAKTALWLYLLMQRRLKRDKRRFIYAEFCRTFGISRWTAKRAVTALKERGIVSVERIPKTKGIVVQLVAGNEELFPKLLTIEENAGAWWT